MNNIDFTLIRMKKNQIQLFNIYIQRCCSKPSNSNKCHWMIYDTWQQRKNAFFSFPFDRAFCLFKRTWEWWKLIWIFFLLLFLWSIVLANHWKNIRISIFCKFHCKLCTCSIKCNKSSHICAFFLDSPFSTEKNYCYN